jgi:mercuric ion binding protein
MTLPVRCATLARLASSLLGAALAAAVAPRTVTLSVPDMNCATCPITVKQALVRVPGVEETRFSLQRREAVVRFDDARTKVQALTEATRNAGYPSQATGPAR